MKLLPGFTAELSLRSAENPYYLFKQHTSSNEVIPSQIPIPSDLTRSPHACFPTFSFVCIRDRWPLPGYRCKLNYTGMACG